MLSAVQPSRYESLQNYILGGRKRAAPPAAVPTGRVAEPRLPNQPTQQPSSGLRPLPTSSQRPWQPTNQRVPYPRLMHSTTSMHPGRPTEHDIGPGDVVFVYRNSVAPGSAPNQLCSVASLPMMNHTLATALLADGELSQPGYARLYVEGPHMPSAAARYAVRLDEAKQELEKARSEVELQLAHSTSNNSGPTTRYGDSFWKKVSDSHYPFGQQLPPFIKVSDIEEKVKAIEKALLTLQENGAEAIAAPVDISTDWRSVPAIRDFKLDGVVINVDSDDDADVERHRDNRGARNDGLLFNVCVAGPTPCRNSRWAHQHNRDDSKTPPSSCDPMELGSSQRTPQTIDDGCRVMDHFFVGLVATAHEKNDGSGQPEYYTFQYRLFSSRQLYLLTTGGTTRGKNGDQFPLPKPGGVMGPITLESLHGLVVAWKIGTVMDDSLVRHPERQVLLNVVVEEWSVEKLIKLFNYAEDNKWSLLPEFIQTDINKPPLVPAPALVPELSLVPAPTVEDSNGSLRVAQIESARPDLVGPIAELNAFVQTVPLEYNESTIPEIEIKFESWKEEFKQNKDAALDDSVVELFRWLQSVVDDDSTDTRNILQNDMAINASNVNMARTVAALKKYDIYDTLVEADKKFVEECASFVEQVRVYSFLGEFWKESRGENEWKLVLQEKIGL